jgi:YjbE family integral membrane protein
LLGEERMAEFVSGLLQIILINIILSGDNAVVIGMAAHRLEPKQRRTAILVGGLGAIVLRVVLTIVAAALLMIPGLRLVGGLLLVWIAIQLLEEEEEGSETKAAGTLREAITTILIADLVMSIDNVLGVAAASNGNFVLLGLGLVISMAILMFLGGLVANLIDRFWWLAYVGAGVIAWTAADLVLSDPFLQGLIGEVPKLGEYAFAAAVTLATLAFAHWFHRMRPKSAAAGHSTPA